MKAWYTSKTMWVAFVLFVVSALQASGVNVPVIAEGSATMNMILSLIFGLLRIITKKPIVPE
jgi:uncharacterized membrane protein